ncbi:hypothetical protein LSAT2_010632 [Lamellibrachia satsuma]|nr:hypothetical protein LSAT2_010632 [Lamellibrachia satsuma]
MKGYIMMFLIVTALLAIACSAAKLPSEKRFRMCMNVCAQNFMKCRKSCPQRPTSVKLCHRKLEKCKAKCEKRFRSS